MARPTTARRGALLTYCPRRSVNATMRDFDPSVINITFARLVLAASVINAIPPAKTTHLPPKGVADKAARFYMSNIYPLYPAFPESAVLTLLADLYQRDSPLAKSSESWLFWMVLAIGSAAQSTSANDNYYQDAIEFVARALPHADRALTPGYVSQIQSLLLLTQYSMLDPTHFESWHLNAFTCRAVVDLGFHQDPVGALPSEELDERRRTFYCVYSLDRLVIANGRWPWLADTAAGPLVWFTLAPFLSPTMPSPSSFQMFPSHCHRTTAPPQHPTYPCTYSSSDACSQTGTRPYSSRILAMPYPTPRPISGRCAWRCGNGARASRRRCL